MKINKNNGRLERLKRLYHEWDNDGIDLSESLSKHPLGQERLLDRSEEYDWNRRPMQRLSNLEVKSFYKIYPFMAVALCAVIIAVLLFTVASLPTFGSSENPTINDVYYRYVEKGMEETGGVNTVAGVILDYRAFDTLGESHVLYAAVTAVLVLLLTTDGKKQDEGDDRLFDLKNDIIVKNTARLVIPFVFLFGVYIMLNGHLSPGGGFSGGAIIGAGLILYSMTFGEERISRVLNIKSFRIICLSALCFYSLSKCYSFFCGANGYETIFTTGTIGNIISAGLILPLNIAVGIVVSCTMYGIFSLFQRGRI